MIVCEEKAMSEIERLRDMIGSAKRIVAFTGAGISTESGIPDFPFAGRHLDQIPADLLRRFHVVGGDAPRLAWGASSRPTRPCRRPSPMPAIGRSPSWSSQANTSIITQNVDAAAPALGLPDSKIIELHGN